MQCIYALTFYLSFEAFREGFKAFDFANLAEVFLDFSLETEKL